MVITLNVSLVGKGDVPWESRKLSGLRTVVGVSVVRWVKTVVLSVGSVGGAGVGTLKLRNEPLKIGVESVRDGVLVVGARGGLSVEKKRKNGAMEEVGGVGVGVGCGVLALSRRWFLFR